ncbi:indoleamine 2,3-dioxygenase [[Candida] anglica]
MVAIPRLEDYDVFLEKGFLPDQLPLVKLPQDYYQPWENLVNNLPSLILTKRVRKLVDDLPSLSTEHLSNRDEYRRAYQCLTFMAQGYVWSETNPTDKLPENIAKPLLEVSDYLGLPPLATYAGLCLWNYKEIIPGQKFSLDNLTTINTFTGSIDESWFYLVSVYFEYEGASCIKLGLDLINLINNDADRKTIIAHLQELAESIDHLGSVLLKMEEMCDPHVFYFRIRPFLAGWKGMNDLGLNKDGVLYGNETTPRNYVGGSNAQSSLIQFLDILLSVQHHPTGERPVPHQANSMPSAVSNSSSSSNFMNEMRDYMPEKHRNFLKVLEQVSNIREYVSTNGEDDAELILCYDACLAMLKSFRDKHIQIVTRYIVLQARQKAKMGSNTMRSGLAKKGITEKGTGGTSLLPFLKQCRDETGDPAAGNWGKRILSDGVMRLKYSKPNGINEE